MNNVNGSNHGGPLNLNPRQRAEILAKIGLSGGWVLMSVSEMFDLKKAMEGSTAENERLNQQTARILAQKLVHDAVADKALRAARATFSLLAESAGHFAYRADALREMAHIDEALSILPSTQPLPPSPNAGPDVEPEKKEDKPNG